MEQITMEWIIKPYIKFNDSVSHLEMAEYVKSSILNGNVHITDDPEGDNIYFSSQPLPLEILNEAHDYYQETGEDVYKKGLIEIHIMNLASE